MTTDEQRALARVKRAAEAERKARERLQASVADARKAGASWEKVGKSAGIAKQNAHKRFAKSEGGNGDA